VSSCLRRTDMPRYRYSARDSNGRLVEDILVVDSTSELRSRLRRDGLFLVSHRVERRSAVRRGRVGIPEVLMLVRQLRTMVQAGMPLVSGLETLSEQLPNPVLRSAMAEISRGVSSGRTLADSMSDHRGVFPEILLTLVRSGEEGGRLPESLREAGRQIELSMAIRQKVVNASIYPLFTLGATFAVLTAMLIWIVPVFAGIYKDLGTDLPGPTQILVNMSNFLRQFLIPFALLVAGAVWGFRRYSATPDGRLRIDGIKLRIPLLSELITKAAVAGLAGSLSGLLESGVPLIQALRSAAAVCGNRVLADAVSGASTGIAEGRRFSEELGESGYFPRMVVGMISISEEVGTLPEVLRQISESYQEEVEQTLRRIVALMEPTMILFAGGVVGFVLVALYFPIFMLPGTMMKNG
jgi:type IV pilus assembly protein PilC